VSWLNHHWHSCCKLVGVQFSTTLANRGLEFRGVASILKGGRFLKNPRIFTVKISVCVGGFSLSISSIFLKRGPFAHPDPLTMPRDFSTEKHITNYVTYRIPPFERKGISFYQMKTRHFSLNHENANQSFWFTAMHLPLL
jgi:hypothetical protein